MSHQYLLPCSCGRDITIDATQAGETVVCTCGHAQVVPTLRGVRSLRPVEVPAAAAAPTRTAAPRRIGCLFAASSLVFLIATIAALVTYRLRENVETTMTAEQYMKMDDAMVDQLEIDEAYAMWEELEQDGLRFHGTPFWEEARVNRIGLQWAFWASSIIAAAALLIALFALTQSRRPRRSHGSHGSHGSGGAGEQGSS